MASFKALHEKKEDHKLIERKRRRDMKSLCSLLTSLIPEQHLKEKRSLPDQLLAAAFYINDLQKNVEDLEKKRERLRVLSQIERHPERISCFKENGEINVPIDESNAFPMVKLRNVGLEIHVTVNTFKQTAALWSLLEVLEGGGLEVETALQSTGNNYVFYTLQCKISDVHRFDYNVIYERLWQLVGKPQIPISEFN
ncbi:hypothetical protein SUGI_0297300 [Cryptomeria japonica]|uniref:transcription factor bHLH162 n=1 Tax=Cryptomeria japonica TaxID=3369 RepID=UPI002408AD4E|nr:transcription factor bHLH162 [Cryptomeria japonica]GLJ17170.1 hypothetical protein SUGI_0297300 [Cryptomeria japonica]